MKRFLFLLLFLLAAGGQIAPEARRLLPPSGGPPTGQPRLVRYCLGNVRCNQWVDSVMETLTLEERVAQLFIYTIAPAQDKANRALLRQAVRGRKVGGLLFSGGRWEGQAALANEAQRMADVPLLVTFDGEWGLSMRLEGMPEFPRNMVLGCIRNDTLLYEYGREMARQCREMGVQANFAPVADVNVNPRNPVIGSRSFGEDPANVARKAAAYARGLEDGGVLSVCKHFPGHGATETDSHKALPALPFSRQRLDSVELLPFRAAVRAGLGGIMVGHLEVPAVEPESGRPASLSRNVVAGLLQGEMGFKGLVFTDALAMKGAGKRGSLCLQALMAGNDLLLAPPQLEGEMAAVADAVRRGDLPRAVIDKKCRKVLTYKYALGLSRKPFIRLQGLEARIRTAAADSLAGRLYTAAITVAGRRAAEALPLDASTGEVAVLHTGSKERLQPFLQELSRYARPAAFRLEAGLTPAARRRLWDELEKYKCILACVDGQQPESYLPSFSGFTDGAPVIFVCFEPEKTARALQQAFARAGALVMAHTARSDVQRQTARILFGKAPADGRLSTGLGDAFPVGDGVSLPPPGASPAAPGGSGLSGRALGRIDSIAREGIRLGAYPGCQVVVMKDGKTVYDKAFGTHSWRKAGGALPPLPVLRTDIYDVASLTKVAATLLAVMKLYDRGQLGLDDRLGDCLPFFARTGKRGITVRQLLLHESGLPSTLLFYRKAIDGKSYAGPLVRARRDALHPVRVGRKAWANPRFRFEEGLAGKSPSGDFTLQVADSLWLRRSFRDSCLQMIADAPLRSRRYRYSCVGFILLQQIVEAKAGMPMDKFLQKEFYGPMGLKRTGFLPLRWVGSRDEVVPSSVDGFLRKQELQGYVHDESAAFLGGVAGNAGLFSTAEEVAAICQMLLDGGEWKGTRYLSAETCRVFTTASSRLSRRGLGFDRLGKADPSLSSYASSVPAAVYGHTGFTGTCAWVDPERRMVYVFLCNRTYPDPWNTKLTELDIRARIQETLYEAMQPRK